METIRKRQEMTQLPSCISLVFLWRISSKISPKFSIDSHIRYLIIVLYVSRATHYLKNQCPYTITDNQRIKFKNVSNSDTLIIDDRLIRLDCHHDQTNTSKHQKDFLPNVSTEQKRNVETRSDQRECCNKVRSNTMLYNWCITARELITGEISDLVLVIALIRYL